MERKKERFEQEINRVRKRTQASCSFLNTLMMSTDPQKGGLVGPQGSSQPTQLILRMSKPRPLGLAVDLISYYVWPGAGSPGSQTDLLSAGAHMHSLKAFSTLN